MDPLDQTNLRSVMSISKGEPNIVIGIIDGPVQLNHPAFQRSRIRTARDSQMNTCKNASSIACSHGTFVAGILCAERGLSAPAICPNCEIILNPVFMEEKDNTDKKDILFPSTTPEELAIAIIDTVNAGARVINLSLGLSLSSLAEYDKLLEAYDYALHKSVIIIVAAGNQGSIGNISLINHRWIVPVAACDENGHLDPTSNFGPSIGNRGLMAPGVNVMSTSPSGSAEYTRMSGTGFQRHL